MSKYSVPSLLLVMLVVCSPVLLRANPTERATKIAPYVDEQTIAILYVDVERLNVSATLKRVAELVPNLRVRHQIIENVAKSRKAIELLKEAGGELYVVFSTSDLPAPGPYLIVSLKQGADVQKVIETLQGQNPDACEQVNDVIYTGSAVALERIKGGATAARPGLVHAFAAAGDAPAQLIIAPSTDHRRVIQEMMPRWPEVLGGGSSRALRDIEWLAVGITFSPKLRASITSQSPSNDSALALKNNIGSLFFSLSREKRVREAVPDIDELLGSIVPRAKGRQLKLSIGADDGNLRQLIAVLGTPVEQAQASAQRQMCSNHLKQLALGMHNYHAEHKHFPSAASHDDAGKALLSWRVHLLPYLDQKKLHDQFHLDEPWDSPHNKQLISRMPEVLACPSTDSLDPGKTTYLVPTGANATFRMSQGTRIRDIRDGTSNTIMILDVAPERAVVWTQPRDIEIDPKLPLAGLGNQHDKAFATAFCDGSVRFIPTDIAQKTFRWLIDPNDGNLIPDF